MTFCNIFTRTEMAKFPEAVAMHLCSCACGYMRTSFDGDLLLVHKMCAYSQATHFHAVAMNHSADEPEMHLYGNGITEAGATQLADALRTNTTLKHLGLNNNKIGDAGATQLADALRANTTLQHLYLCDNAVTEAGATQLADALRTNSSLQTLLFVDNNVGEAGARQLADALRANTTLQHLYLCDNAVTEAGLMMLHDAIATDNCTLETLRVMHLSWERSFKRLLAPAARSQRRRAAVAWRRRRVLLLCLYAAGLLPAHAHEPQPQKKTGVLLGRGAFGDVLANVGADLWPRVFAYL
jgi:hypothetical protein